MSKNNKHLITYSILFLLIVPTLALAANDAKPLGNTLVFQFAFLGLGCLGAYWQAHRKFRRREILLLGAPMLPIYMTRRPLYWAGMIFYGLLAGVMFVMIVFLYPEIHPSTEQILPSGVFQTIEDLLGGTKDLTLTVFVIAAGILFYFLLQIEKSWNPVHYIWQIIATIVGIPRKARHVTTAIRTRLEIPQSFDFNRDGQGLMLGFTRQTLKTAQGTTERNWVESVYMYLWLMEQKKTGQTLFFDGNFKQFNTIALGPSSEFNMVRLLIKDSQKKQTAPVMGSPATGNQTGGFDELADRVDQLHAGLARLVACYLIYTNGSEVDLWLALKKFGVSRERIIRTKPSSILFCIIGALAAVVVGLIVSSVGYDLYRNSAIDTEGLSRTLSVWLAYTISMYCLPIFVVMIVRYIAERMDSWTDDLHPTFYAATFLLGMFVSGFVLVIGQMFFPTQDAPGGATPDVWSVYSRIWLWTIAPGLLTAFVAYRMDAGRPLGRDGTPSKVRMLIWGITVGMALTVVVGIVLVAKWDEISMSPMILDPVKFAFTAECTVFAIGFLIGTISGIGLVRTVATQPDNFDSPDAEALPPDAPPEAVAG